MPGVWGRTVMNRSLVKWTLTLLAAALLSLEIASVWYELSLTRQTSPAYFLVVSVERGALTVSRQHLLASSRPPNGVQLTRLQRKWFLRPKPFVWLDARLDARASSPYFSCTVGLAPLVTAVTLPIAAMWLIALRRFIRDARSRGNRCRKCGYDLTGLPLPAAAADRAKPICPECGTA